MKHRTLWTALTVLTVFIALTAGGGGLAMLAGIDEFPLEWLEGTPFNDYGVPALILTLVVGGTSFLTALTVYSNRHRASRLAMLAGLVMVGYIIAEVVLLNRAYTGPDAVEWFYLGVGLIVFGLAAYLWLSEDRGRLRRRS